MKFERAYKKSFAIFVKITIGQFFILDTILKGMFTVDTQF